MFWLEIRTSVIEKNTLSTSIATPSSPPSPPSPHAQSMLKQALAMLLLGNNIGKGRGEQWKIRSVERTNYTWNEKYTRIGLVPATSTSPAVYLLKWLVPPNYSENNFLFQLSTDFKRLNKKRVWESSRISNFSTHAASLSGRWKCGRWMLVSWLVRWTPDRAVRVQAVAIVSCSWARHFTPTVPLSTQGFKWVSVSSMLGVTLRWTCIPSMGEKKYS